MKFSEKKYKIIGKENWTILNYFDIFPFILLKKYSLFCRFRVCIQTLEGIGRKRTLCFWENKHRRERWSHLKERKKVNPHYFINKLPSVIANLRQWSLLFGNFSIVSHLTWCRVPPTFSTTVSLPTEKCLNAHCRVLMS